MTGTKKKKKEGPKSKQKFQRDKNQNDLYFYGLLSQ